jgi:hypothetical protein
MATEELQTNNKIQKITDSQNNKTKLEKIKRFRSTAALAHRISQQLAGPQINLKGELHGQFYSLKRDFSFDILNPIHTAQMVSLETPVLLQVGSNHT